MSDPFRDLNDSLGEGNPLPHLQFTSEQEGPNHQAVYTGTYTFRGVVVGRAKGTTMAVAKRNAATQALQYFQTHGIPE